jgi:hypothetical protein
VPKEKWSGRANKAIRARLQTTLQIEGRILRRSLLYSFAIRKAHAHCNYRTRRRRYIDVCTARAFQKPKHTHPGAFTVSLWQRRPTNDERRNDESQTTSMRDAAHLNMALCDRCFYIWLPSTRHFKRCVFVKTLELGCGERALNIWN